MIKETRSGRSRSLMIGAISMVSIAGIVLVVGVSRRGAISADDANSNESAPNTPSSLQVSRERNERKLKRVTSGPGRPLSSDRALNGAGPAMHAIRRAVLRQKHLEKTQGLERASNIDLYLLGVLETVRAIDPSMLESLRDQIADALCAAAPPERLEVVILSRLIILDAGLGSARAVGCTLNANRSEDIVLWTVLDAWNAAGQPPLPAIAAVQREATDERTRRRLLPREEQSARRMPLDDVEANPKARENGVRGAMNP